jgi:hypothetical protein
VKDLKTVMENYWNILGIGPWDVIHWEAPLVYDRKYHGEPAWAREIIALTQVGGVQLELCQPVEGNSVYLDSLAEHGEGLHHLNFLVDDVDETASILAEQGFDSPSPKLPITTLILNPSVQYGNQSMRARK